MTKCKCCGQEMQGLLDRRKVNNPYCARFHLSDHIIHSSPMPSGMNNTVIEHDTGDCIICTRLSDYRTSEIWIEHPDYPTKSYSDIIFLFRYKTIIPEWGM